MEINEDNLDRVDSDDIIPIDYTGYNFYESNKPIPQGPNYSDTEWLPKTDWGRDKIIANDD